MNEATEGIERTASKASVSVRKYLDESQVTAMSGMARSYIPRTTSSNPLYIDSTMIRAQEPTAMPIALMSEMMLMTLCDFLAKR